MSTPDDVRLIAFVLPQLHAQTGNLQSTDPYFNGWQEVVRAKPLFAGHHQPRWPGELGFYDMRLAATRQAQAALARAHGIHGFCYYVYGSATPTDGLLETVLRDGAPDMPFCVCWVNETGAQTRNSTDITPGRVSHVETFFDSLLSCFRDSRYIKINNRPLLLIYHAELLADVASTIARWGVRARERGFEAPYVVAVEHFYSDTESLIVSGYDAVCELPPHLPESAEIDVEVETSGTVAGFQGRLLDYERLAQWFLRRPPAQFPRLRGVTLGWDNTACRGPRATVVTNFSVAVYRDWLRQAIEMSRSAPAASPRLLFVNAWNDWSQGCYLEPDELNGLDYLTATAEALGLPTGRSLDQAAKKAGDTAEPAGYVAAGNVSERAAGTAPNPTQRTSPLNLVGICCVGNDADIIEAFVRHNLDFLDYLIILEHNTFDGTREILNRLVAEGLPIFVEHSSDPQFRQVEFTNRLLKFALESHRADWVFPLDCDEFILAQSRKDLDAALVAAGDAHIRLKWVNYVPTLGDDRREAHPLRRIRYYYDYPTPSVDENPLVWKVAINAKLLGDAYADRYEICSGNHFLALPGERRPSHVLMLPQQNIRLAHFPARSVDQMMKKSALGILTRLGTGDRHPYYAAMWKMMTSGTLDFAVLADSTRAYLDSGRQTSESLRDTPMRFAPVDVTTELRYQAAELATAGVLLKWIERNALDAQTATDSMLEDQQSDQDRR